MRAKKISFLSEKYSKSQTSNVKLMVYDMLGKEIATFVDDQLKPGSYEVIDGSNLANGVYFHQLRTNNFIKTTK
jgi:hypothetical protein